MFATSHDCKILCKHLKIGSIGGNIYWCNIYWIKNAGEIPWTESHSYGPFTSRFRVVTKTEED